MSIIPFSPPRIDQLIIDEVSEALRSGWISTGMRTKKFEKHLAEYCDVPNVLCLNSATAGLEIILRWFGVGDGDEVILPAYTYSATANVIIHCGATPVFVDVNENDFNISVSEIEKNITAKTKVIMPVDFAGFPCDYHEINQLANKYSNLFSSNNAVQEQLGRILVLSDSAHSFGANYKGRRAGSLTDISVFSFHAVKNLTTGEGGAVALNLPAPFDNQELYNFLCVYTLHGQNKDALAKMQKGNWKYDIIEAGYKCNMTDIAAAIGLVELSRYDNDTLPRRRSIINQYNDFLKSLVYLTPIVKTQDKESSYHLYPLRLNGFSELQRDSVIKKISENDVSVNVHFIPVPMMTFYKKLGYDIRKFPVTYKNFSSEISLPVFYNLENHQIHRVCEVVDKSVTE
ncbi:MAG: DegT/DnrJ/EryC1/StrS family aminotransferase, partial [Bacteroidota bacterium]